MKLLKSGWNPPQVVFCFWNREEFGFNSTSNLANFEQFDCTGMHFFGYPLVHAPCQTGGLLFFRRENHPYISMDLARKGSCETTFTSGVENFSCRDQVMPLCVDSGFTKWTWCNPLEFIAFTVLPELFGKQSHPNTPASGVFSILNTVWMWSKVCSTYCVSQSCSLWIWGPETVVRDGIRNLIVLQSIDCLSNCVWTDEWMVIWIGSSLIKWTIHSASSSRIFPVTFLNLTQLWLPWMTLRGAPIPSQYLQS